MISPVAHFLTWKMDTSVLETPITRGKTRAEIFLEGRMCRELRFAALESAHGEAADTFSRGRGQSRGLTGKIIRLRRKKDFTVTLSFAIDLLPFRRGVEPRSSFLFRSLFRSVRGPLSRSSSSSSSSFSLLASRVHHRERETDGLPRRTEFPSGVLLEKCTRR